MFRASMCTPSGENHYIYANRYLSISMGDVWSAGWISIQPADQTPP